MAAVSERMIQNFTNASVSHLEPHWGYASRVVPCTNDPGSCAYLDVVYRSHDLSMLYSGILWALIGGILLVWAVGRRLLPSNRAGHAPISIGDEAQQPGPHSGFARLRAAVASSSRRHLLPDSFVAVFGHTTRLQVLVLAVLAGYLLVFNFVGIVYNTWITPISSLPGAYNTRTSLGPWSDRIGVLAYALTPLCIMLCTRESILSLVTGIPYQSFLFLHRWVSYIILIQSALHTIGWCIIEWRLYQPQPSTWNTLIAEPYMIWGVVGMVLLLIIWIFSLPWTIKATGYEFFRKAHYVLAMVYIGALIGHWPQLECFLIPGLVIWFLDRAARATRTALLHYRFLPSGNMGFSAAQAALTHFPDGEHGDAVRLDFRHPQAPWAVGQHFYLCFPESSIWQSHPFTPLTVPALGPDGAVPHSYVFRSKGGETKTIAQLAAQKLSARAAEDQALTTPVVLAGPYGQSIVEDVTPDVNILCIAGGTGISFVLPVLLSVVGEKPSPGRKIELAWIIRREADTHWIEPELDQLRSAGLSQDVKVRIFVTREPVSEQADAVFDDKSPEAVVERTAGASASLRSVIETSPRISASHPQKTDTPQSRRPDLGEIVSQFVSSVACGPTRVFASGPLEMTGALRAVIAAQNQGGKVWRGDDRFDVRLICDDRIEW